jgi:transposase
LPGRLSGLTTQRSSPDAYLFWDEDGLVLYYKRLEEGTFVLPHADGQRVRAGEHGLVLKPAELAMLLAGIDLSAKRHKRYQRPQAAARTTSSSTTSGQ